jgi:adenylate cyclase
LEAFFIAGGDPMATGDVKRKLTAIFSADVEGYSRLMEEDELATVETLTSHKGIMGKLIKQYRGRVVDSTGDNLLAEFGSVVDAVQCAVEVQQVLSSKNEALPKNRRMHFRIGINSGDVIEEGELIYGDGVNVAARVESMAEGGGISISGTAYDQLGKKLPLGYEYLGEQSVKNIEKPVRVYRILTGPEAAGKVIGEIKPKTKQLRGVAIGAMAVLILGVGAWAIWNFYFRPPIEPASVERMAHPLPDKPSIAVLPFKNMSGDPEQEYFSDGISESIILGLSKVGDLFVIARNSSFTYKGKPVKVQKVSEDLGVRYILEGSLMKSGDRVRINAQLIDAVKGHHMWAERYDRNLSDIFAIQDEITMKILQALRVTLTKKGHMITRDTDNLDAYLKYLEGLTYLYRSTKEDNLKAKQLYEKAIALDPDYVRPKIALGWAHFFDARFGWVDSRRDSIKKAFILAKKALELNDEEALGHALLGVLYMAIKDFDKAIEECERGVALNPNASDTMMTLGAILSVSGRWEEGANWLEKSIRHEPFPSIHYFYWLGRAYVMLGRYDEAVAQFDKAHNVSPIADLPFIGLAIAYGLSGRAEDAQKAAEELIRINPKFSIAAYAKTLPYKKQADKDTWIEGLRKAGLPETPPLPLPDKPSIAVLPFVNMSGDPEQEYFSDGITETIITGLSKTPKLFVIARNSAFTYKGKPTNVQKVGRELGVRHVLEGSVQRSGDRLRITAQLVDAKTGNHLWAEQYDRELKDIFALQDEITMKIITAMRVELTEGERVRVQAKGTDNLQAYLKFIRGEEHFLRYNADDFMLARQFFEEAIVLDPEYPDPYIRLGSIHFNEARLGVSKDPQKSVGQAFKLAQKALSLDETNPYAHSFLALLYLRKRQFEKAIAESERAIVLSPNHPASLSSLGLALSVTGRPQEAIPYFEKAIRFDPSRPWPAIFFLGDTYRVMEQYEKAIPPLKKALEYQPNSYMTLLILAACYGALGREEEAKATVTKLLKVNPDFSLARYEGQMLHTGTVKERLLENCRKAGLK